MASVTAPIQSTAGAVPVFNEKGELSMQKVKVHRYVSGKRPEYAPESSSGEESDEEFPFKKRKRGASSAPGGADASATTAAELDDRRIQRLQRREVQTDAEERMVRHRHIHEPEIVATGEPSAAEPDEEDENVHAVRRTRHTVDDVQESSDEEELDEETIGVRRARLRALAREKAEKEVEIMDVEEEGKSEEEISEEESEYEEYSDSEEETGPRLKPVFVRRKERITVQEKERQEKRQKELENEARRLAEERRRHTLKLVEDEARKELMNREGITDPCDLVDTGDENDEAEYESWKLRELKRIKREREEREAHERERLVIERLHNMSEEERRLEQRANPRIITNKATKGKYKFLQKYYHRGAFFIDNEDGVFKRDFSQPTLEDHFDKTILPKVMQVKNFGRSGRTKYTHLVDQDTTQFDSPWVQETAQNLKFNNNQAGGVKQGFERPCVKKRKK